MQLTLSHHASLIALIIWFEKHRAFWYSEQVCYQATDQARVYHVVAAIMLRLCNRALVLKDLESVIRKSTAKLSEAVRTTLVLAVLY